MPPTRTIDIRMISTTTTTITTTTILLEDT